MPDSPKTPDPKDPSIKLPSTQPAPTVVKPPTPAPAKPVESTAPLPPAGSLQFFFDLEGPPNVVLAGLKTVKNLPSITFQSLAHMIEMSSRLGATWIDTEGKGFHNPKVGDQNNLYFNWYLTKPAAQKI